MRQALGFVLSIAIASCQGAGAASGPAPVGFASVNAVGQNGTTGGGGGETVTVTNADRLSFFASRDTPYIIQVQGTIALESLSIRSDKTVIGVGDNPGILGGIYVNGHKNVIIRNLAISGSQGDGISILNSAHHVWVDHCDLSDARDGLLDITRESDFVTVSWCKFHYSNATNDHRFASLIGGGDRHTNDLGKLRVTFHHNWWAENCIERLPSVRYGRVHLFNNYYTAAGNNYCIRSRLGAEVLVENNYFSGVKDPHVVYLSGEVNNHTLPGRIQARGNGYTQVSGTNQVTGAVFVPPYTWKLDNTGDVPTIVKAGAGRLAPR